MSNLTVEDLNRALEEKLVPLTKKIEETNTAITFINHKYEEILCKLSAYESERKELMNENKCLKSQLLATTNKLNVMAEEINNLEQYSRRECVEIRGIPLPTNQSIKENTDNIVIKVANLIGVKIKNEDISVSHRLQTSKSYKGRNKEMPPIIVKFTRRNIKESLYKARTLLKGFSTKDLGYVGEDNIFITESLTSKNKEFII